MAPTSSSTAVPPRDVGKGAASAGRSAFLAQSCVNCHRVRGTAAKGGYAPDLTDIEIDEIGKDPFLVAAAMSAPDRVVVTVEVSAPKKQRQNRKLPDVCTTFGILSMNPFELYRTLKFSIT